MPKYSAFWLWLFTLWREKLTPIQASICPECSSQSILQDVFIEDSQFKADWLCLGGHAWSNARPTLPTK